MVATRLLRHARRRRDRRARPRHPVSGRTRPRTPRITGKLGFSKHPMLEHFKFLKAHTRVMPKMCIPSPATLHFRLERTPSRPRTMPTATPSSTIREYLSAGDPRLLRRRLPLPAIRRHRLGLSVLASGTEEGARARAERRPAAAGLCPRDQCGARWQARRHDDHDACLPRQFPLDLDFRGRL